LLTIHANFLRNQKSVNVDEVVHSVELVTPFITKVNENNLALFFGMNREDSKEKKKNDKKKE